MEKQFKGYFLTVMFETDYDAEKENAVPDTWAIDDNGVVSVLFEMNFEDEDGNRQSVTPFGYDWRGEVASRFMHYAKEMVLPQNDDGPVFTTDNILDILSNLQFECHQAAERMEELTSYDTVFMNVGVRFDKVYEDGTIEEGLNDWCGEIEVNDGELDWNHLADIFGKPDDCPDFDWSELGHQVNYSGDGDMYVYWIPLDNTISLGVIEKFNPCDAFAPFEEEPKWVWYTSEQGQAYVESVLRDVLQFGDDWSEQRKADHLRWRANSYLEWVVSFSNLEWEEQN